MKKVLTIGIGGRSFVINEDAYEKLEFYLKKFKGRVHMGIDSKEVMNDLEDRIADLFTEALGSTNSVVSLKLVESIIIQLGMPDGSPVNDYESINDKYQSKMTTRKFYRDPDSKVFGGVCGGVAAYLDIDVLLVRIHFVIALFCMSAGFWAYLIFWFVAPMAKTAAQKCEMRGIPVTAENMRRFQHGF